MKRDSKNAVLKFYIGYEPGPMPATVIEPGAICVLPASLMRLAFKPIDLASLAICNLSEYLYYFTKAHNLVDCICV